MAAVKDTSNVSEANPMTGGDCPNSYAKNSLRQRGVLESAKEVLSMAIAESLDLDILLSPNTFNIADLGRSVGPNTFLPVVNILEAVESKCSSHGLNSQIPEFQVFFSDHTLNDFNILFPNPSLRTGNTMQWECRVIAFHIEENAQF